MIRLQEFDRPRKGARLDRKLGRWVGYRVDFRAAGRRHRGLFETRSQADAFVDRVRLNAKLIKAGAPPLLQQQPPTLQQLLDARLGEIPNVKEQVRARRIFQQFRDLLPPSAKITDVRRSHFQRYINQRGKDVKLETVNRELNTLSKAFSSAAELFPDALEDYEPPKIKRPRFKKTRRERTISPHEKDLILQELSKQQQAGETVKEHLNRLRIARMFHMAWLLGLRFGEIAKLVKSDYDPRQRTLRVHRWKTGTTSFFEDLPQEVHSLLDEACAASSTDFIFTLSGGYPSEFYPTLKAAIEAAGLRYGRQHPDGIVFHTLRHSFVSRLVRVTDLATAQTFTGHSTGEMVALYSHASPESRRQAMQALYGRNDLKEIYERVKAGEMSFEDFSKVIT